MAVNASTSGLGKDIPLFLNAPVGRKSFTIPHSLTENLLALSQQEEVTAFVTLLAAWSTLLYRYSDQEQVFVGIPVTGRNQEDIKGLTNLFVDVLPLDVKFSDISNFRELLQQMQALLLSDDTHQTLPFDNTLEILHSEQNPNDQSLFQTLFIFYDGLPYEMNLSALITDQIMVNHMTTKCELSLEIINTEQGFDISLEYSTDLFDEPTIERMVLHFGRLLEGCVSHPELPIDQVSLLSGQEQEQLLREWNATQVTFPQVHVLHQLVEEQSVQTPDAIAVVYEGVPFTYRHVNQRANQLARFLLAQGIEPETLVGIAMERSVEMVVGLLGILKAGAAYVPLEPTYPRERLDYLLRDAQVSVLLTQQHLVERLPASCATLVCLDTEWERISRYGTDNPRQEIKPEQLAYVIYTSGSTGKPKGAMNTHRSICNRLLWMQKEYVLDEQDRVLQKTPSSFDVSVWEFFWPLISGASLMLARPEGQKDAAYLVEVIKREEISTIHFVPSMLQLFIDEPGSEQCSSLKRVICSGEALTYDLQERFLARMEAQLHNLYGPTEAAVDVASWICERKVIAGSCPLVVL